MTETPISKTESIRLLKSIGKYDPKMNVDHGELILDKNGNIHITIMCTPKIENINLTVNLSLD